MLKDLNNEASQLKTDLDGFQKYRQDYESNIKDYAQHKQAVSLRLIQAAESVLPGGRCDSLIRRSTRR